MDIEEAKAKISALLNKAEEDNKWGGEEDSEGLHPGLVEWDQLKEDLFAVIDDMTKG